jgi:hypothetical protein
MAPATVQDKGIHRIVIGHQDVQIRRFGQQAAGGGGAPPGPPPPPPPLSTLSQADTSKLSTSQS